MIFFQENVLVGGWRSNKKPVELTIESDCKNGLARINCVMVGMPFRDAIVSVKLGLNFTVFRQHIRIVFRQRTQIIIVTVIFENKST